MFPSTHVIVGVTTDPDTFRAKGRTVICAADRACVVKGCKYVDEVIENCEPVLTPEFMNANSIDYFAHADTTDLPGYPDPYRFIKEEGRFLVVPRVKEWGSTTQIISTIIRNRDEYVIRQLRNGASRADLGVPWLKLQWIKTRRYISSGKN
jgi:glycerol-3-phosphate cytidylyltransferase-like family protein